MGNALRILMGVGCYLLSKEERRRSHVPFNGQFLRRQIFSDILEGVRPTLIIETGTYHGATTAFMAQTSRLPVFSVEAVARSFGFAWIRLFGQRNVHLSLGDSRSFLKRLSCNESISKERPFVYLDAHWQTDLPLSEELHTVFSRWPQAVVMIDDFQVPGDPGYGYDCYPDGVSLDQNYIRPICRQFGITQFYPAGASETETGFKRGCTVLALHEETVQLLQAQSSLRALVPA